mmetsp:Transcript_61506/g.177046  ORF Transcript_61506/g.177046 Transcript_61506/m.177046 type:complete len:300 (-) Transcript_61506:525-1424(-)
MEVSLEGSATTHEEASLTYVAPVKTQRVRQQRSLSPGSTRLPSESGTYSSFSFGRRRSSDMGGFSKAEGVARDPNADELLEDTEWAGHEDADDPLVAHSTSVSTEMSGGFLSPGPGHGSDFEFDSDFEEISRGGFHDASLACAMDFNIDFSADDELAGRYDIRGVGLITGSEDTFEQHFAAPERLFLRCVSQDALDTISGLAPELPELELDVPLRPAAPGCGPYTAQAIPMAPPSAPTPPPPGNKPRFAHARRRYGDRTPTPSSQDSSSEVGSTSKESSDSMAGAASVALLRLRRLGHR